MGSDWDYINEHMGGHDEDGLPNFINDPGFSDEHREPEPEANLGQNKKMMKKQAYFILENLIARTEIEGLSLRHITSYLKNHRTAPIYLWYLN